MGARTDSLGFLHRARRESQRYGHDPWVLLRELGQNSRDAGATRIEVRTALREGLLELAFGDDGAGMSRAHAQRYLFRLYASSKEAEGSAAGRFGVGFWSVLRFEPAELEVHSRTGKRGDPGFGVWLDGALEGWRWLACAHAGCGTTVLLRRSAPGGCGQLEAFRAEVRAGLERTLVHLRRCRRGAGSLPVFLDGELVSRPLALPGADALEFVEGPVEGVVGFGPRPAYRLFARGLPVAEGAFLEELEAGVRRARPAAEREGVAPVFLLNGNDLKVVLSRQEVVRDRALERLLAVARGRFDELVARTIDGAARPSAWRRLGAGLREAARGLAGRPAWVKALSLGLLLAVCGGGLGLLLARATSAPPAELRAAGAGPASAPGPSLEAAPPGPGVARSPLLTADGAAGMRAGSITPGSGAEPAWALRYRPPGAHLFRLVALEEFSEGAGFSQATGTGLFAPPGASPAGSGPELELEVELPAGPLGRPLLPQPTGFAPADAQARLGGAALPLEVSPAGLLRPGRALVGPGTLRYRLRPGGPRPASLRAPPGWAERVPLPPELARVVEEGRGLSPRARLAQLSREVQARIAYDRSPEAAARMLAALERPGGSWPAAVVAAGAGDCDVMNGLLVLLLARAGLPARLAVGIAGQGGGGVPGLHAWVEVWLEGRLEAVDLTAGARPPAGTTPGPAPAPALDPRGDDPPAPPIERAQVGRLLAGLLLGLAALVGVLLLATGRGGRGRVRARAEPGARRTLLAGMAEDALRRPRAWRHVPGLWHRPYLPCLHDRRATLAELVEGTATGALFLGRAGDELAEAARRARALVLDADDPWFGPLYGRVVGLRELAELALDRPVEPGAPGEGSLLEALGRALEACGAPACRMVEADPSRLCHDVDLSPLRPARDSGWPPRFVALHRAHPWLRSLAAGLAAEAPALAAAVLLDRLAVESSLLAVAAPALRRRAARLALEEVG